MGSNDDINDTVFSVYDGEDIPEDIFYGTQSVESEESEDVFYSNKQKSKYEKTEAQRLYSVKNVYMERDANFRELTPREFLSKVFWRPGYEEPDLPEGLKQEDLLPFEEKRCDSYIWWLKKENGTTKERRSPKYSFVYNGIAQAIFGKKKNGKKKKKANGKDEDNNRKYVITRLAPELPDILKNPFVIISPVSYTGNRRLKQNARYLYAITIDLDCVDAERLDNLLFQSDPSRGIKLTFPQPNIIVNSGTGVHLYYLLESPTPMFNDIYPVLNKIKKELTRRVWNAGTTGENPDKPQYQGNCQGFRMPGTKTKHGQKVRAFLNVNPLVKPYYSLIDDLVYCGGGFLTDEEYTQLKKGNYHPQRITLKQAKELYPEWYDRRIVKKISTRKEWHIKRDLYDWWKEQIMMKASVGHRYFCLLTLSMYARKCQIPEDEVNHDVYEFVKYMDALSKSKSIHDRFTKDDAKSALKGYKEQYLTFPRDEIAAVTGITIKANLRHYNSRSEHGRLRAMRRKPGWKEKVGRKNLKDIVLDWRETHPEGKKCECIAETQLSKKTVYKWWDAIRDEDVQVAEAEIRQPSQSYWDYMQTIYRGGQASVPDLPPDELPDLEPVVPQSEFDMDPKDLEPPQEWYDGKLDPTFEDEDDDDLPEA